MPAADINTVVVTGNLTRDPELTYTASGIALAKMRLASTSERKVAGEWTTKPNYFDVIVWGALGETIVHHLSKGSQVAVDGRLDWREWTNENDQRRQAVQIIADRVRFFSRPVETAEEQSQPNGDDADRAQPEDVPVAAGATNDDIPF